MMENPTINHHKAHKSEQWRRARCASAVLAPRPRRQHSAAAPLPPRVPELVFAQVHPGFVATCMVEATGSRVELRERVGPPARPGVRLRAAGQGGRIGTVAGAPPVGNGASRRGESKWLSPCGRRPGHRSRTRRNGHTAHLAQVAASLRGGVRRGSAITARERADASGPILTTLGDHVDVKSNIFKFIVT